MPEIDPTTQLEHERAARLQAEQRLKTSEELARVARAITESLDVTSVATSIVDAVLGLFNVRASGLRLLNPEGGLVGIAFGGEMQRAFPVGHVIDSGPSSVSGLAIMAGRAAATDNAFADRRLRLADDVRRGMTAAGDAAVLAVPLKVKGRPIGALSIADHAGRHFTDVETETLQAFADQAALAIESARLYEEARRRQREAEVLAELARRINASLDLDTTLEHVLESARELSDGDLGRIALRNPETGQMQLRYWVGTRWQGYRSDMTIEPGKGSGGIVLATGKPFRTENYPEDPQISKDYIAGVDKEGVRAQIVVPITGHSDAPAGDDGIVGLLYVDRRSTRPFTEADEAVLLRLAGHAAIAIRNSRLFAAERAARADADAANTAKDRFLAILSHELRTPLNAIMGWSRVLRSPWIDEAQRTRATAAIERNARRQAQLVNDLLDTSRIAAGKLELERFPVDLIPILQETIDTARAEIDAKRIALTLDLDSVTGEVLGDPLRLQQVFSNILGNAIKFTPEGGGIAVTLGRHAASARVTISDTGEGIEPAMLASIFEPFQQGDTSATRHHQGLGLGLSIVRQIVELHGGTVRAESAGKGAGATFTLDLPIMAVSVARDVAEVESGQRRAEARPERLGGIRALVVDDQADARELIAIVLREEGAEVRTAGSMAEALEMLADDTVDVLISDLAMPGGDGYDLIGAVRAMEPRRGKKRIRAVALTAYIGRDVRDRTLAAGFDAHATKPMRPDDLVSLIGRLSPARR